ncbi:MAG: hypothetical protein KDI55_26085 [Anaerolineae bacterium]|nr:hypothetical protein [Anaerolineae bacterium]
MTAATPQQYHATFEFNPDAPHDILAPTSAIAATSKASRAKATSAPTARHD